MNIIILIGLVAIIINGWIHQISISLQKKVLDILKCANAPVCAPSRSTWITGMYAVTTGTQPMRSRNHIPHDIISYYPDILKSNGYFVGNDNKTDYNIGGREDRSC